jgi:hypothetical protein
MGWVKSKCSPGSVFHAFGFRTTCVYKIEPAATIAIIIGTESFKDNLEITIALIIPTGNNPGRRSRGITLKCPIFQ